MSTARSTRTCRRQCWRGAGGGIIGLCPQAPPSPPTLPNDDNAGGGLSFLFGSSMFSLPPTAAPLPRSLNQTREGGKINKTVSICDYMRLYAIIGRQMDCRPWAEPGAGNEPCPNLHAPPPLSLTKNQSCLPAAHDGRDTIFLTRTSLLPPLSSPSALLPPCSPAGGCFAWGRDCRPPPLPQACHACILAGWRVQACLRQRTGLSSSSLLLLPCPGAGTDAKHTPYLPFFFSSLAGPLAEPAPCR